MDEKQIVSKFLRDYSVTEEFAEKNPDQATQAWDVFRSDWGIDATMLEKLRMMSVKIRLDPTTDPTS